MIKCEDCTYYWIKKTPLKQMINDDHSMKLEVHDYLCVRYPHAEKVTADYWCGEYKTSDRLATELMAQDVKDAE